MPSRIEPPAQYRTAPNLRDYEAARRSFSWDEARAALDGLPAGGLNIAYEAIDRHVAAGHGARTALRAMDVRGRVRSFTYAELQAQTSRFANALRRLGVGRGDRVFLLSTRVPELYVAALGTLKLGAVICPLFSAFGPEPIRARARLGGAQVVVTTARLFGRKLAPIVGDLPDLRHVVVIGEEGEPPPEGTLGFHELVAGEDERFEIPATDPEEIALLHFTSGTSGTPKGALHAHQAVVAQQATARWALDLHPEDVYWCTADPGWVTGTIYGLLAPFVVGATVVVDEAEFDAARWLGFLQDQRVSVWYTAPTAVRMISKVGEDVLRGFDTSSLRLIASVGEALPAESVLWAERAFGLPIHDNWWQTETGAIMIANFAAAPIEPGSMGRPVPGIEAAIVKVAADGRVERITEAGATGQLALRAGWPSMFRGYLGDEKRYRACFADGWYLSGDLARCDADGYFWFVGRADDAIKSAGHLIGPVEVERALAGHAAVHEVGVIGKPHEVAGEIAKAFVVLRPGHEPSAALQRDLLLHARQRLGPAVAPKEIEFRDALPRTRSGKIMRRLLRARELGLPEGDLSVMDDRDTRETTTEDDDE